MATLKLIRDCQKKINIICIPGGPGLGPISFELMTKFIEVANVYFYYPSGTDGKGTIDLPLDLPHDLPLDLPLDYENQLSELFLQINILDNIILLGHSFGGILATDLMSRYTEKFIALICIAAPFSKDVFKAAGEKFSEIQNAEGQKINEQFKNDPTDENYKKWFSYYSSLYFKKGNEEVGKQMILSDSVCAKSFLEARAESESKEYLLAKINKINKEKLFIMGSEDALLKEELLSKDAINGKFCIQMIKDAGHFVHFDQPKEVANVIEEFIKKMEK